MSCTSYLDGEVEFFVLLNYILQLGDMTCRVFARRAETSPFPHNLDLQHVQVFSLGASSRIELGDGHSCIDSLFNLAYIDFLYILSS